jgi:hypothetical protein
LAGNILLSRGGEETLAERPDQHSGQSGQEPEDAFIGVGLESIKQQPTVDAKEQEMGQWKQGSKKSGAAGV